MRKNNNFLGKQEQKTQAADETQKRLRVEAEKYLSTEVMPALEELKTELEKHGREVSVFKYREESATIIVKFQEQEEFHYTVETNGLSVRPVTQFNDKNTGKRYSSQGYYDGYNATGGKVDIYAVKKDEIISHFLKDYQRTVHFK